MSARWIKRPGPGQFRGQGEWKRLEETGICVGDWMYCRVTGYLPTHEGDEPPDAVAAEKEGA